MTAEGTADTTATTQPRISVVIPTFESHRFIGETLDSLFAQTVDDYEVVVTDNSETDRTEEIVRAYGDPRVRYTRNRENIGAVPNWNNGLSLARGRYLKLLHADDLLTPTCLERQAAVLDDPAQAGVALVTSRKRVIDTDGRVLIAARGLKRDGRLRGEDAIRLMVRTGTNVVGEPSGVLMRAEAYRAAGEWDARAAYVVDVDMWWRLLRVGDLYNIADPLFTFRMHGGSWSKSLTSQQTSDFAALVDRHVSAGELRVAGWERALGTARAWVNTQGRRYFYWRYLRDAS